MNNKGFTLVELLAVMLILIAISLVAVGGISSSLEKRDEKELEEQQELAIGAAKIYFSLNDDKTCVKIQTLIDNNYISKGKKVDKLNTDYTIKLNTDKYVYSNSSC
jgi:type II secretory pathway pseudopilin PulG